MSRKHYRQMVEILKQYHPTNGEEGYKLEQVVFDDLVTNIMTFFKMDNNNFNFNQFLDAVYPE